MKKSIIILVIILIIGIAGFLFYNTYYVGGLKPVNADNEDVAVFEVEKGQSVNGVAKRLVAQNLIKNEFAFKQYAKKNGLTDIKAGKYELKQSMSVDEILNIFVSGKALDENPTVTIPEGYNVEQIADLLSEKGLVDREKFLELCKTKTPEIEGVPSSEDVKYKMEGFLFPDTYKIAENATEEDIIELLHKQFLKVYGEEKEKAANTSLNAWELTTLASMVEEESKFDEDRPIVAGVFYNRLAKGQKLESCVTVIYALGEHRTKLYYRDLDVESPYNTYRNEGLPVGPISNPGRKSIAATFQPADTEYYYFKSDSAGKMYYSKTLAEHEAALKKSNIDPLEVNSDN